MSKKELEKQAERVAMNIVYQLGDILEASVDKRQATNDKAIDFVQKLILDFAKRFAGEEREIGFEAISRLNIMAVELALRQKDKKALEIINDILKKYEELKKEIEAQVTRTIAGIDGAIMSRDKLLALFETTVLEVRKEVNKLNREIDFSKSEEQIMQDAEYDRALVDVDNIVHRCLKSLLNEK